jgi:hypothetical protein
LFLNRGDDGLLTLEHQKSNLGMLREPLVLAWVQGGLPQVVADGFSGELAKGRTDDDKAISLLKLIAEFESRGQYSSPATTSRNHVHAMLKSEPAFLNLKLRPDDVRRLVNQCQRAGWIEPIAYRSADRKPHERWSVTAGGRSLAGLPVAPTAPTAPTAKDGAVISDGAKVGAPTAPTTVGGVGGRARTQVGAKTKDVGASSSPKKRKPRAAK